MYNIAMVETLYVQQVEMVSVGLNLHKSVGGSDHKYAYMLTL